MTVLPGFLTTFVPGQVWTTLQEGEVNMEKTLINITAAGTSQLNQSNTTFTDVYVNAPGLVTLTLPLLSQLSAGQEWTFKDASGHASANTITLAAGVGYNIDGGATFIINSDYGSIILVFDGTNFRVKL